MKIEAINYQVIFGGNLVERCQEVIYFPKLGARKQIIKFKVGEDGKYLFYCKVKDENNNTIVKVANSILQYHKKEEGYEPYIDEKKIKVVNEKTGETLLDFEQIEPRKFKLNGIFHFQKMKIIATDEHIKINTTIIKNNTFKNFKVAIKIILKKAREEKQK